MTFDVMSLVFTASSMKTIKDSSPPMWASTSREISKQFPYVVVVPQRGLWVKHPFMPNYLTESMHVHFTHFSGHK